MNKISIGIELDSKPTKSRGNLHNILIRATKNRKSRRHSTEYYVLPKNWNNIDKKVIGGRRGDLNAAFINDKIEDLVNSARLWLSGQRANGIEVSLDDVISFLSGKSPEKQPFKEDLNDEYDFFEFSKIFLKQKKAVNQDLYRGIKSRLKKFKKFCNSDSVKNLSISDINAAILLDYQKHLLQEGKAISTINLNVNVVKEVLQLAMNYHEDEVKADVFLKVKSLRGAKSKIKEKLTRKEIELFEKTKFENIHDQYAVDIFLFCYYMAGSRIRDALKMRYRNIETDITYVMGKNKKIIVIEQHKKLEILLNKYKELPHEGDDFIFPYLEAKEFEKLTVDQQVDLIYLKISRVNYYLRKAAKSVGINKNVTTHIARHSFALHYFEETGDLKGTSELLAHGSLSTTDRYLRQHGIINNSKKVKGFYDKE